MTNKKIIKNITIFSVVSFICFGSINYVNAKDNIKQNLELVPVNVISYNPESGWYPGMSNDSEESYDDITLSIQNKTTDKIKIRKIYIKKSGDLNNLTDYITDYATLDIRNNGKSISKVELKGLPGLKKEIDLSKENIELLSGQQKDLDVIVNLNEEMGNEAQEKELRLSFSAGYEEIKSLIPLEPEDPTEKPGDSIEKPGNPTEKPGDSIEKPGNPTEKPGDSIEKPGNPTEKPGDSIEKPGNPTEKPGDSMLKPETDKDKLPQTGRIINSTTLGVLGLGSMLVGMLLNKKGTKYKGGKSNE